MKKDKNSLLDIIRFLYSKRKTILSFTLGVGILMALVSFFLPDYYKASTTFYAGAQSLNNPEQIFGNSKSDMYFFGSDSDMDRLLAISDSRELNQYIIEKYDLASHYDTDTTNLKSKERLYAKFKSRLDIKKNKYDAIELSFEDKDRELVADVVRDCSYKINQLAKQAIKKNQQIMIEVCERNISKNTQSLAVIEDSIASVTVSYNILNPDSQGEQLAELIVSTQSGIAEYEAKYKYLEKMGRRMRDTVVLIKAALEGLREKQIQLSDDKLGAFSIGAGKLKALRSIQEQLSRRIGYDVDRLQQLNSAFNANISAIVTIEEPVKPFTKSRPVRSLLVLGTMIAAFFYMVFYLLFRRSFAALKTQV